MDRNNDEVQPIVDEEGRTNARKVARAYTLTEPGHIVRSMRYTIANLVTDIGLALLTMNPPRTLDLAERKEIVLAAIAEAGWVESIQEEIGATGWMEKAAPAPQKDLLVPSTHYPGYYALGIGTGRHLTRGDLISLQVKGTFINAQIDKARVQGAKHYALTEDGPIELCAGMRIILRKLGEEA